MRHWLLCALLATASVAAGSGDAPVDFAFGIRLETPGPAAVYRLLMPQVIYRTATREDLGDLRIFNAAGKPVPHALRHPRSADREARPPQELRFFPFERSQAGGSERVLVKVHTDPAGAVVDVDSSGQRADQRTVSYLIDASGLQLPLSALSIEWRGPDVARVALHVSEDLQRWRRLREDATLARLAHAGQRFEQRRIEIPTRTYKYLRLRVPESGDPLTLVAVQAEFEERTADPQRDSLHVLGERDTDEAEVWRFDTGGRMPVERIELSLPQPNSVVSVVLRSRPHAQTNWRLRGSGILYRLDLGQTELSDSSIGFPPVTDRWWRLEVTSDPAGLGAAPPELEFAWRPHVLQFLARGPSPFLLAYGNADMRPSRLPIGQVLERIGEEQAEALVATAHLAQPVTLGGDERLRASRGPFPWLTLILWTVLLLGVALIGWMALRLFRQMNA